MIEDEYDATLPLDEETEGSLDETPQMLKSPMAPAPRLEEPIVLDPEWTPAVQNYNEMSDYDLDMMGVPKTADQIAREVAYEQDPENAPVEFGELLGAYWETESTYGALTAKYEGYPSEVTEEDRLALDDGWTAMENLKLMGLTEPQDVYDFGDSASPSILKWRMNNRKRERANREIMSRATVGQSLGAGLLAVGSDPLSWAFVAVPFVKGGMMARAAYGAKIGAAEAIAAESILHYAEGERTLGESFLNVGAATVFGGVLGPLAGRESKAIRHDGDMEKLQQTLDDGFKNLDEELAANPRHLVGGDMPYSDPAMGASPAFMVDEHVDIKYQQKIWNKAFDPKDEMTPARANELIEQASTEGTRIYLGKLFKPLQRLNPVLDIGLSLSHNARKAVLGLSESSLIRMKNFSGGKSQLAIDTQIQRYEGQMYLWNHNIVMENFTNYAQTGSLVKADMQAWATKGQKNITSMQFKEAVSEAVENGGEYTGKFEDAKEFIENAAKQREEVMKGFEKKMLDEGILTADNQKAIDAWQKKFDQGVIEEDIAYREAEFAEAGYERHRELDNIIAQQRAEIERIRAKLDGDVTDRSRKTWNTKLKKADAKLSRFQQQKNADIPDPGEAGAKAAIKKHADIQTRMEKMGTQPERTHTPVVPYGSKGYLPRVFRMAQVARYKKEFIDAVVNDWLDQAKRHMDDAVDNPEQHAIHKRAYDDMVGNKEQLEYQAGQIQSDIVTKNIPPQNIDFINKGISGRLKGRTLRVRTSALRNIDIGGKEPISFIESDIMKITKGHLRAMVPEYMLKKNKMSLEDMPRIIKAINDDYQVLIDEASAAGKNRKVRSLISERERITTKVKQLQAVVAGRFGYPNDPMGVMVQAKNFMQTFNVMRMLGSMTISAITDLGNLTTYVGMRPLAQAFADLVNPIRREIRKDQSKKLGLVTELVSASRMNALMMSDDMGVHRSVVNTFMANRSKEFTLATGMNHWNTALKEIAVLTYADEIIGIGMKLARAQEADRAAGKTVRSLADITSQTRAVKFAAGGIDENDFLLYANLFKQFDGGKKTNGLNVPGLQGWVDKDGFILPAAEQLMDVLKKQADMAVVTPGSGDLPLMMRTPVGSLVGQFKSFSFTAINRIMLPNIQRMAIGDPNAYIGMTLQFGLGAAVYNLKMFGMGREDEIDNSWGNLIGEAVDRSGYFGIGADVNAIMHKATRGEVSAQALIGHLTGTKTDMSRYYSRSAAGDLLGPTGGTATDMFRVFGSLFGDGVNRGDISSMRRLVPYQNLYWTRRFANMGEEAAAETFIK